MVDLVPSITRALTTVRRWCQPQQKWQHVSESHQLFNETTLTHPSLRRRRPALLTPLLLDRAPPFALSAPRLPTLTCTRPRIHSLGWGGTFKKHSPKASLELHCKHIQKVILVFIVLYTKGNTRVVVFSLKAISQSSMVTSLYWYLLQTHRRHFYENLVLI